MRLSICLVAFIVPLLAFAVTIGKPEKSRVPAWDLRGPVAMPVQSTACLDVTPDGRFCAVGTYAFSGAPQLFLLDDGGKVLGAHNVGERGVMEVAVGAGGGFVAAVVGVPMGTAGDIPGLKVFANGKPVTVNNDRLAGFRALFHYGDHGNHLGKQMLAVGDRLALGDVNGVAWITPATGTQAFTSLRLPGTRAFAAFACADDGRALVGRVAEQAGANPQSLALIAKQTVWSQSPGTADGPALAPGVYGAAAGKPIDARVYAPLSVAVSRDGARAAAAEYPGWRRTFPRGDDYGLHFPPTRPTIAVYDIAGAVLCRVDPAQIDPGWYDLAFTTDGTRLLIYPHNYVSQGLGGVGFLPADLPAKTLYVLTIADGTVTPVTFPDAIAGVGEGAGRLAVSCWNGTVYALDGTLKLSWSDHLGAAARICVSTDGNTIIVAGVDGVVYSLTFDGHHNWRTDLNAVAYDKPAWVDRGQFIKLGEVWMKSGQRTHSDMGNQYVIEAPDGLLLVDPNAGLTIDNHMAQMRAAGLDPMRVKYVLLTHEHGDHAPGAYLWRLRTGAQVVSSPEMAHSLQHHIPIGTGYGFNPVQPVDILVDKEQTLTLAGLPVTVVRLPGHTSGSLGYLFTFKEKRYAALGDLIMPRGVLGYSGSVDFSPQDALASLRRLQAANPEMILGGHGGGTPDNFIAEGIAVAAATGWGRMAPTKPDTMYRFARKNYRVTAWQQPIAAAAFGDIDGDGAPDVATLVRDGGKAAVQIYRNAGGTLPAQPDLTVDMPGFTPDSMSKLRLVHLSAGPAADIVATSEGGCALLQAQDGKLAYKVLPIAATRVTQVMVTDLGGKKGLLLGGRFIGRFFQGTLTEKGVRLDNGTPTACNFDMALADIYGDGKPVLITAAGEIFPRTETGFADTPDIKLATPANDGWNFLAVADFTGDGKPDVALMANTGAGLKLYLYPHTGDTEQPYAEKPALDTVLAKISVNRDGPTVGDWTGDGIPDLIVQDDAGAVVLPGSKAGLDAAHLERIPLDYTPHHDTKFTVADFTGDGKPDLAGWGGTYTGAGGVYVWVR